MRLLLAHHGARMLTSSWIARFYSLGVPLLAVPDPDARRRMESLYIFGFQNHLQDIK